MKTALTNKRPRRPLRDLKRKGKETEVKLAGLAKKTAGSGDAASVAFRADRSGCGEIPSAQHLGAPFFSGQFEPPDDDAADDAEAALARSGSPPPELKYDGEAQVIDFDENAHLFVALLMHFDHFGRTTYKLPKAYKLTDDHVRAILTEIEHYDFELLRASFSSFKGFSGWDFESLRTLFARFDFGKIEVNQDQRAAVIQAKLPSGHRLMRRKLP